MNNKLVQPHLNLFINASSTRKKEWCVGRREKTRTIEMPREKETTDAKDSKQKDKEGKTERMRGREKVNKGTGMDGEMREEVGVREEKVYVGEALKWITKGHEYMFPICCQCSPVLTSPSPPT